MTAISRLVVVLGADSAQFVDELTKADRQAKGFADNATRSLKAIGTAALALGTTAATGLAALAVASAKAADELADVADKLGVSTERLAGFQLAAKLAGISNEALEKSLGMAARRLAEFNATGEGAAGDWLKKLGLDAQELARLAPDQLFIRYADAIGGLSTRGEQLAAVSALMGDRTGEMLRLVQGGAGALSEATQKAKDYGVALTRIEAGQIQLATDAIDEAKFALQGLGTQTALAFAPLVELIVSDFNEAARSAGGFKTEIEAAMLAAAQTIGIASNAGIVLSNTLDEIQLAGMKLNQFAMGDEIQEYMLSLTREGSFAHEQISKALEGTREGLAETEAGIAEIQERMAERTANMVTPEAIEAQFAAIIAASKAEAEAALAALNMGGGDGDSGMSERDLAAIEALKARLTAEEELKLAAYQRDRDLIDRTIADEAEKYELLRELETEFFEWKLERDIEQEEYRLEQDLKAAEEHEARFASEKAVRDKADAQIRKDVEALEKFMLAQRKHTYNLTVGLLHSLAGESKTAAYAAIALEKGTAIARTIMSTAAAVMKASEQMGVYAAPAIAGIIALGAAQVALIASTGIAQAGSVGSSGAALGTAPNPVFTQPGTGGGPVLTEQGGPQQPVYIVVNGPWVDPNNPENIINMTRDAIENSGEVLFAENSQQMLVIGRALGIHKRR